MGYRYLSTSRGAGNPSASGALMVVMFEYRYLSTSRGVGNVFPFIFPFPIKQYSSLSTSRGAVNGFFDMMMSSFYFVQLPIYLERGRKRIHGRNNSIIVVNNQYSSLSTSRGAGNSTGAGGVINSAIVQFPIYLERGRKLTDSRTTENHHWVQLPIYLERGRKHFVNQEVIVQSFMYRYL